MLRFVEMCRHFFTTLLLLMVFCAAAKAQDEERAIALFEQAQAAHEKGDLTKAVELYKETIKLLPDQFEPKYQCALACLAVGSEEFDKEAAQLLAQVAQIKPDFARGHAALGLARVRSGDAAGAEAALKRAVELDDKLIAARAQLAELLIARGAYKEAEAELKIVAVQSNPDARVFAMLGIAEQGLGRFDEAIVFYGKSLELDGKDNEARFRRGKLYSYRKNYAAAAADMKIVYEANGDSEAGFLLADAYSRNGEQAQAVALAKQLLTKDISPELRTACADLLARLGASDPAAEELEKALAADPNKVEYLVRLGEIYLLGQPEKAITYWQRAASISPKTEHLVGLGSALLKAQRFEESIDQFSKALAQSKDSYEAHAGLGLAYYKLDRYPYAAQEFIWMIRARPQNSINYYFLGICFDRLLDFAQALKAYELFLKTADPKINQLEIDKVNLRLPILRRQLERKKR